MANGLPAHPEMRHYVNSGAGRDGACACCFGRIGGLSGRRSKGASHAAGCGLGYICDGCERIIGAAFWGGCLELSHEVDRAAGGLLCLGMKIE